MKRPYYIFSNGRLRRRQGTLYFEPSATPATAEPDDRSDDTAHLDDDLLEPGDTLGVETDEPDGPDEVPDPSGVALTVASTERIPRKPIPVADVEALYLFGEVDLNTKALVFLGQQNIPLHVFNYYGFYSGSYVPRGPLLSGALVVRQVAHYADPERRIRLARAFIEAASFNLLKNLRYYHNRGERDLGRIIADIETLRATLPSLRAIADVMGTEGQMRQRYYSAFDQILTADGFAFGSRQRRPPGNELNALTSFGNALCYTTCLGEIYRTQLNSTVSYLHEPGARRHSLALDLAEIFKPLLVDRVIFRLVNNGEIQPRHFERRLGGCYLTEAGRQVVVRAYDEKLKTTISHRGLGRPVSYRRLVRLDCYKLIQHLNDPERDPFKGFTIWW